MLNNLKYKIKTHIKYHISEVKHNPADFGKNCLGNGKHKDIFGRLILCQCDECDSAIGCLVSKDNYNIIYDKE